MKSELHVPSDLCYISIVENWLLGCLELTLGNSVDMSSQSTRLRLVLVEAYSNAVRHAHKDKIDIPIILSLEVNKRNITLEIWDHGEGFDLSNYSPPKPEDKKEGGYGWLIMTRLMDKVEYRLELNGGNCLKLETTLPE
jgi:serine/threonine-protein kinase RsbW